MSLVQALILGIFAGSFVAVAVAFGFMVWLDRRRAKQQLALFTPEDVEEIRERLARIEAAQRPSNVIPFPRRHA